MFREGVGLLLVFCFLAGLTPDIANAEGAKSLFFYGGIPSLLATKNSFYIRVNDEVTGGCLPNPETLKDKMEVSLRRNNFGIDKEGGVFGAEIVINALGYKAAYSCVVHVSINLVFYAPIKVPFTGDMKGGGTTLVPYVYAVHQHLLSGSDMQNRVEKSVSTGADTLFLNISRARDETFTEFPEIEAGWEKSLKAN